MKVLLDECVVQDLRHEIVGHNVFTAAYMGWSGLKNGALLARAAAQGFDVIVTVDHSVSKQQNLSTLPIPVVVMWAKSNDIDNLIPLVPDVLAALDHLKPRTIVEIGRTP